MIAYLVFILSSMLLGMGCNSPKPLDSKLTVVSSLPSELDEASGLVSLGGDWYVGTNDSGNPPELYVFNLDKKESIKTVKIKEASNHDWEELTSDDRYVYIGDTGNNSGNRKNLAVYRVKKEDLRHKEEVDAEVISYHYPEQQTFEKSDHHNFDCEAMVTVGDSLYLFTKNRGNLKTDLYSIPKTPGSYAAKHLDQFDAKGLVTGAGFKKSGDENQLALIGYTEKDQGYHPFLLFFSDVKDLHFFQGHVQRLTFEGKMQTETVLFNDDQSVYITNEGEHGDKPNIYRVMAPN